jgi:hypothetical protein
VWKAEAVIKLSIRENGSQKWDRKRATDLRGSLRGKAGEWQMYGA